MTTSEPQTAYVWTWLPGTADPVVAGRVDANGPVHVFTYARSYLVAFHLRNAQDQVPLRVTRPGEAGSENWVGLVRRL